MNIDELWDGYVGNVTVKEFIGDMKSEAEVEAAIDKHIVSLNDIFYAGPGTPDIQAEAESEGLDGAMMEYIERHYTQIGERLPWE
jgi:hypothetical protein